jgi:uncharacterized protein YvpB
MKKLIFTIVVVILIVCAADKLLSNNNKPASQQASKYTTSKPSVKGTIIDHSKMKAVEVPKEKVQKKPAASTKNIPPKHSSVPSSNAAKEPKKLNVPLYMQMSSPRLYNGCEVTSLAMVLNYNGYHVTKNELAARIHTVPLHYQNGDYGNPNVGFVGDMEDGPGLGVYHRPILELARKYAGKKAEDLTGVSFSRILEQIDLGHPVWVITTSTFAPVNDFKSWKTPQGIIHISFSEHSVVITGYDQKHIYINNPYGMKDQKVDRENFIEAWNQMGKQAIIIKGRP